MKPVIIIALVAGIVIVGFVGVYGIILVNEGTTERNCMTGLEYREYMDYYRNECPDNFKELGFESSRECHDQRIALFDPNMCR